MLEKEIAKYLEKHYLKFYNKKLEFRITHLEDKGYYYQFNVWKDNIVMIGETILKLDLEISSNV